MKLSRRTFVAGASAFIACRSNAAVSDQELVSAAIENGETLPARAEPYILSSPVRLRSGQTLRTERGVRIIFAGAIPGKDPSGILVIEGNGVSLSGGFTIESEVANRLLYGVAGANVSGLSIEDVKTIDCNLLYLTSGAKPNFFQNVETSGPNANINRDIKVRGGGSTFRDKSLAFTGHGACFLGFCFDWIVTDARFENVRSAVQWWGGNSDHHANGMPENERKCGRGLIRNVRFANVQGGIWGSMGTHILVEDCSGKDAADVGFDAEGCYEVVFRRNRMINARNGCFTTFFLNRHIQFIDCEGYQPAGIQPLFRVYNSTQSALNGDVAIIGGHFECTNGISSIDTLRGPARKIILRDAELVNARVDFTFQNANEIIVEHNRLLFTRKAVEQFAAIRTGTPRPYDGRQPSVSIRNNKIETSVRQPAGSQAVLTSPGSYKRVILGNAEAGF